MEQQTKDRKVLDGGDRHPNEPKAAHVDWFGLALELETQAKRVESQSVERAMLAGAHGLRLIGATQPPPVSQRPSAWIKGHTMRTEAGIDYDEEVVAGSESPPGEGWHPLYSRTAECACEEFVRMQHDIARLLGVDAETDSIDLHQRIYGALSTRASTLPGALREAAEEVVGAYEHRFETAGGRLEGPIDNEIEALRRVMIDE